MNTKDMARIAAVELYRAFPNSELCPEDNCKVGHEYKNKKAKQLAIDIEHTESGVLYGVKKIIEEISSKRPTYFFKLYLPTHEEGIHFKALECYRGASCRILGADVPTVTRLDVLYA